MMLIQMFSASIIQNKRHFKTVSPDVMEPYDLDHHPVNAPIRSKDQRYGEYDAEQVMPELFLNRHPDNAYHKERYAGNQKTT